MAAILGFCPRQIQQFTAVGCAYRTGSDTALRIIVAKMQTLCHIRQHSKLHTMSTNPENTTLTPLDICNLALSRLGESPIAALDANGSLASRLCYMHYHPVRREVLCANRWSFAIVRVTLRSAEEPQGDDTHQLRHSLPQDCLRVLGVNARSWTLRGRAVYASSPEIRLQYIADVEDSALFDPLFTEALVLRLAWKLCIPLINSTTARQALGEEYQRVALPQAAHFNAVQHMSNDSHPLYRLWRNSLSGQGE